MAFNLFDNRTKWVALKFSEINSANMNLFIVSVKFLRAIILSNTWMVNFDLVFITFPICGFDCFS